MELDDLKSAWSKFSSENEKKQQLSEGELQKILKKRTLDITDKIRRNIRIGIGIVLGWISLGFAIDFLLPPFIKNNIPKPSLSDQFMFWSYLIDAFNYVLIFSAIIIFWIRYNKLEKENTDTSNLKSNLKGLIGILNSYRRMFYIIMGIIILQIIVSFSSGFLMGFNYQVKNSALDLHNLNFTKWIIIITAFIISLGIFVAIYYLLFALFFKRLYGRYLKQLKQTLKELEESPDTK